MRCRQGRDHVGAAQQIMLWYPNQIGSAQARSRILQNYRECARARATREGAEIGNAQASGSDSDVRPWRREGAPIRSKALRLPRKQPGRQPPPQPLWINLLVSVIEM